MRPLTRVGPPRAWLLGATAALVLAMALPAGPIATAQAQAGTCFEQVSTITDNGPGDQDPRPGSILGTPGADVILGTERDEVIDGNGGDDTICGGAGNDTITGRQAFALRLDGGAGDDAITVARFVNFPVVLGGEGRDALLIEEAQGCTLDGGPGDDRIEATCHDTLSADDGPGADTITAHGFTLFLGIRGGRRARYPARVGLPELRHRRRAG